MSFGSQILRIICSRVGESRASAWLEPSSIHDCSDLGVELLASRQCRVRLLALLCRFLEFPAAYRNGQLCQVLLLVDNRTHCFSTLRLVIWSSYSHMANTSRRIGSDILNFHFGSIAIRMRECQLSLHTYNEDRTVTHVQSPRHLCHSQLHLQGQASSLQKANSVYQREQPRSQ